MGLKRSLSIAFLGLSLLACDPGKEKDVPPSKTCGTKENNAPKIKLTGPTDLVGRGATVVLDASKSSDPDKDKLKFLWEGGADNPPNNFLDEVDLTAPKISFKADSLGVFSFAVLVNDSCGSKQTKKYLIEVADGIIPGAPPAVTGVVVNGTQFFPISPAPVIFTDATSTLMISIKGTDVDSENDLLVSKFTGANVAGLFVPPSDMSTDPDGFRNTTVTVWLEDPENHKSVERTLSIRIVPKANKNLSPNAYFVHCADAPGGDGSASAPFNTIQEAYDLARASGATKRPDVYVATGTCNESVTVDFAGVNIYGLFDAAGAWRRRTDPSDLQTDKLFTGPSRFADGTRLSNPGAYALMRTAGNATYTSSLLVDGITFDLNDNWYGADLSSPTPSETYALTIQNSEFIGNATTAAASPLIVGGGIRFKTGSENGNNSILFRRNLFSVGAWDNGNRFQALVQARTILSSSIVEFYSNVFYGGIGDSQTYPCDSGSNQSFAFCFPKPNGDTTLAGQNSWNRVMRNLFWLTSAPASSVATIVDMGGNPGHIYALGNIFGSPGITNKHSYLHAAVGSNFSQNRFPGFAAGVTYVSTDSNYLTNYDCLDSNTFGIYDWGSSTCNSGGPGASSTYYYTFPTVAASQNKPWRISVDNGADGLLNTTFTNFQNGLWDFDGRYGAVFDLGTSTAGTDYNIGPFEPLAPLR